MVGHSDLCDWVWIFFEVGKGTSIGGLPVAIEKGAGGRGALGAVCLIQTPCEAYWMLCLIEITTVGMIHRKSRVAESKAASFDHHGSDENGVTGEGRELGYLS